MKQTYEFTWHVDGLISVKVRSDNQDEALDKAFKIASKRVFNQSTRGGTDLDILDPEPHIYPDNWEYDYTPNKDDGEDKLTVKFSKS